MKYILYAQFHLMMRLDLKKMFYPDSSKAHRNVHLLIFLGDYQ